MKIMVNSIFFYLAFKKEEIKIMEETKKCNCCGQVKPIEQFKCASKLEGTYKNVCKQCDSEKQIKYAKKRRKENKEVKFMLTLDQYKALEERSKELNTTPNKYIKRVILEDHGPIVITKEGENSSAIKELLSSIDYQLGKWGNNLNQWVKVANTESKGGIFGFGKKKNDDSEKIQQLLEVVKTLQEQNTEVMEYMTR
jgi:hypothetical protein